jgi:hypothetical protein
MGATARPDRPLWTYDSSEPPPPRRRLFGDPRDIPPPGAIGWRAQFSGTIGPGPTSQAVAAFTVPPHSRGVVREFSADVNNLLTSSAITWALRIGGAPVPGWTYTQFPFASPHVTISLLAITDRWGIEIPGGSTVDVLITVADGGTYQLGTNIAGWTFPADYLEG